MNIFYKKILISPKSYTLFICLLCFATFSEARLWNWYLYVNFAIFSFCFFVFSKVYFSILVKSIESYQMKRAKRFANQQSVVPVHIHQEKKVRKILYHTHLISTFWFVALPAITLLFHEEFFLKTIIFLFLFSYVMATIIRRLAFKLDLSMGRSFLLILQSIVLTSCVSYLPFIALATLAS